VSEDIPQTVRLMSRGYNAGLSAAIKALESWRRIEASGSAEDIQTIANFAPVIGPIAASVIATATEDYLRGVDDSIKIIRALTAAPEGSA
jgi:hypothetical protein